MSDIAGKEYKKEVQNFKDRKKAPTPDMGGLLKYCLSLMFSFTTGHFK